MYLSTYNKVNILPHKGKYTLKFCKGGSIAKGNWKGVQ